MSANAGRRAGVPSRRGESALPRSGAFTTVAVALFAVLSIASRAGAGNPIACDDRFRCTVGDACTEEGVCVGVPRDCPDDGDACTVEVCIEATGECSRIPRDCSGPCRTGECEPSFGCVNIADSAGCNDDNPCTEDDACKAGECIGMERADGSPCTDSFGMCTLGDRCLDGRCRGDLVECPDRDGNACTFEFCNFVSGGCTALPPTRCDEVCETGVCERESGHCVPRADGLVCDDENPCTVDDRCSNGGCRGRPVLTADLTPTPGATASVTLTRTAHTPGPPNTPTGKDDDGGGSSGGCGVVRPVDSAVGFPLLLALGVVIYRRHFPSTGSLF